MHKCIFCEIYEKNKEKILKENELFFSIMDKYPMTEGHLLIIPKRHFSSVFDISHEEWNSALDLIRELKTFLENGYSPSGYNIGINVGSDAGQSVFHAHIHLIPRYNGDMDSQAERAGRINIPLFEFMRDNDIFKKVILDQFAQRKIDEITQKMDGGVTGEDMDSLKTKLCEFTDDFCRTEEVKKLDDIFQIVEKILVKKIDKTED